MSEKTIHRAKRGEYVAVEIQVRDSRHCGAPWTTAWTVRRVVRTDRAGYVTHLCTENDWQRGITACAVTTRKGQRACRVMTIGRYKRHPNMEHLANGIGSACFNTGSARTYESAEALRAAIEYAGEYAGTPPMSRVEADHHLAMQ